VCIQNFSSLASKLREDTEGRRDGGSDVVMLDARWSHSVCNLAAALDVVVVIIVSFLEEGLVALRPYLWMP